MKADVMTTNWPICQECGGDADVHVTDIVAGERVVYHLCEMCADEFRFDQPTGRKRSGWAAIFITFGAMTTLLSVFADPLALGTSETFGWKQRTALIAAGILVLLGAVVRAQTLFMIGTFWAALALLADWLHLGSDPGFGLQQITGMILGLIAMFIGAMIARARRRGSSEEPLPEAE